MALSKDMKVDTECEEYVWHPHMNGQDLIWAVDELEKRLSQAERSNTQTLVMRTQCEVMKTQMDKCVEVLEAFVAAPGDAATHTRIHKHLGEIKRWQNRVKKVDEEKADTTTS